MVEFRGLAGFTFSGARLGVRSPPAFPSSCLIREEAVEYGGDLLDAFVPPPAVESLLRLFFKHLVASDPEGLAADGRFLGMSPREIVAAVGEYQAAAAAGPLSMPPDAAFRALPFFEPYDERPLGRRGWSMNFDFYFDGERSDLSLIANVYRDERGEHVLEILDLHVL